MEYAEAIMSIDASVEHYELLAADAGQDRNAGKLIEDRFRKIASNWDIDINEVSVSLARHFSYEQAL